MTQVRWIRKSFDEAVAGSLATELGVSPLLAQLLSQRGVTDADAARRFISPSPDQLNDPYLMLGMEPAVDRIVRAIEANEPILIYGDYDVDGTTGTVVLRRALQMLGATTSFHIPHRFTEGYGIQQERLEKAYEDGVRLVISIDCGIRAHEPLMWAKAKGLDVIVTDHHLADANEGAPPAFCVLNPNQPGCKYPDKNLAGVGVAYKLVVALLRRFDREQLAAGFLKMAAIGTVADVAHLTGENRVIVSLGLADLPASVNHGLRALFRVVGFKPNESMTAYDLGFRIGPRINAAGRMDAGLAVIELFESENFDVAMQRATALDLRNRERRQMQAEIVQAALDQWEVDQADQSHVAVIAGDRWHRGVIGIAASKIAEALNRPAIVISFEGETGHGSARSIAAYDLFSGLTECGDLFNKFGGHSHAAGLTLERRNLLELRRRLNAHARSALSEEDLLPFINIDAPVDSREITFDLFTELAQLEPYGAGNPRPVFFTKGLRLATPPRVLKEKHLKMTLQGADRRSHDAIWWGGAEKLPGPLPEMGARIELAYSLETNEWQGERRLQLNVKDLRIDC